jgi:predicted porin
VIRTICLLALVAAPLMAQPKAQISGFVRDTSQSVIQDAAIAVINLDTGIRRSTLTNSEGFYAISSLTPGQYKITVRKPGFGTVARTGVALHGMDVGRLDFLLNVGSVREEITVDDAPPLLNTTDASYGIKTTRRPAEQLPVNGRGLQGLIDLAPGVLITPATSGEAGQFSANGQRPATNYFTVDGVSANNGVSGSGLPGQFSGGALPAMTAIGSLHNLVSLGELDELRVQTSTYAPEYGRLPGAQVAVSTRSGSNEFHGEAFASLRNEHLAAADWFANAAGIGRSPQRLRDFGGIFGGPVLRNRTFFVLSTEQIRMRESNTFLMPVPSLQARASASPSVQKIVNAFPLATGPAIGEKAALLTAHTITPSDVHTTSIRADQGLGNVGSLFVRYNITPSSSRSGYLQQSLAGFRSQTLTVGAVTVLASRLTNDVRMGISRMHVESDWLPGAAGIDLRSILPSPGDGQRLYAIGIRGFGQFLAGDRGKSRQNQWNLSDTIAFTYGRHDVRAGIDYQRLTPRRDQPIVSIASVYDSLESLLAGSYSSLQYAQTGGGRSLIETMSLFAQDTWHATRRLNVTYGVRWEITPAPSYRVPALLFPASNGPDWKTRYNQFAPRIGAAYRLSDRLVLRAGTGLFYDLGFSSAVDLVNGAPYNRWRTSMGLASLAPQTVRYGFAPDLKLPYSLQWNVALERGFGADAAGSITYAGSAGRRLLRREGLLEGGLRMPATVLATNHGRSDYHSLQMQYRSRSVGGLQGTVSYAWAHAIDNGSWDSAAYLVFPGAVSHAERGSANFDVRHSFQAALAYDLGRSGVKLARGWLVSGTFRARTGFPVDLITSEQPFGLGFDNDLRPDLVPGVPVWIGDPAAPGGRRLNPGAFRSPAGQQGTLGRNAIRGNGLTQLDMALQKEFAAGERTRIQLRLEGYNVTNSPSFADPVRVLSSPLFGVSPSLMNLMLGSGRPNSGLAPAFQSGGARVLQVGISIRF